VSSQRAFMGLLIRPQRDHRVHPRRPARRTQTGEQPAHQNPEAREQQRLPQHHAGYRGTDYCGLTANDGMPVTVYTCDPWCSEELALAVGGLSSGRNAAVVVLCTTALGWFLRPRRRFGFVGKT